MAAGRSGRGARGRSSASQPQRGRTPARTRPSPSPGPSPVPVPPPEPELFRLGAVPGATPGKWIGIWNDRMPRTPLELVPLPVADQRRALVERVVDAALVRLPIDTEGLHLIALYEEVPVVVCARDSHLTAAEELELADLEGEVLIVPQDDVLGIRIPGAIPPSFEPPADTADAIATAAAGVGVVVVPMSLARAHHRRDIDHRPLRDGPMSTVALAWAAEHTTPSVETFIGIVRGRTANSSRG